MLPSLIELTQWFTLETMGILISDLECAFYTGIAMDLTVNAWMIATETANGI